MANIDLSQEIGQLWQGLVFIAVVLAFMFLMKLWRDWRTHFDTDEEVEERGNLAVGLRRAGIYLAIAIAMVGAVSGSPQGFVPDLTALVIDGILAVVLLAGARIFNDAVILGTVDNDTEAKNGNVAVGLVEAGSTIATGLILYGAFTGESVGLLNGILSVLAFAVLGQIALFVFYEVYQLITPFNVKDEIKNGNAAAGTAVAGMLVALGFILKASIAGPFVSWVDDLVSFALYAVIGILVLLLFRKVIDWLFLPNTNLATEVARDRNVAAIAMAQGAIIAVALVISAAII